MVRELSIEKRENFLNTALKLFAANGIQHTSTAEIAREAGTAAGTLFLYFPTKQDLINQLAVWISNREAETINCLLDTTLSARDMFSVIWDGSIRWLLENKDAYLFSQQIREPGIIPVDVVEETGKHFHFYYDAIQKGLNEGSIKALPVDLIGGFLYQEMVAVMNYIQLKPETKNNAEIIQQGFEIFWDGIRSRKDN